MPFPTPIPMQPRLQACALLFGALLAGCGGGGGDVAPPSNGPAAAAVTAGNYEDVARASFIASNFALSLGDLASSFTGLQGLSAQPLRYASDTPAAAPLRRIAAARVRPLAETGGDLGCSGGGLVRVNHGDANGNQQFDAGDALTVDLLECVEDGERGNGRMVLTLRSASASAAQFDLLISNLRFVQSDGSTSSADGSLSVAISSLNGVVTNRIEAGQLLTSDTAAGKPTLTQTLKGFVAEAVTQTRRVPMPTTVTLTGQLSDSRLGSGSLGMNTEPSFTLLDGDDYPSSGQLRIRGAAGSQLRLVALSNQLVRLELDANGDDQFETSVTKRWSELD